MQNIISDMKYMKMSKSAVGHKEICKQYLRAFLDISVISQSITPLNIYLDLLAFNFGKKENETEHDLWHNLTSFTVMTRSKMGGGTQFENIPD